MVDFTINIQLEAVSMNAWNFKFLAASSLLNQGLWLDLAAPGPLNEGGTHKSQKIVDFLNKHSIRNAVSKNACNF